jgi:chromatin segregation and condensation protein Rec8/ScpA/Scc1 (kleisin family)
MEAKTATDPEFSIEELRGRDWENVLDRFTEDMDPWAVDIIKLADRYKSYIERLDEFDLEIPARMILICSILLRMKANVVQGLEEEEEQEPVEEEFEDEFEEEMGWHDEIEIPEQPLEPPVKKTTERRVSLDELKDALSKALNIQQKREMRRQQRQEEEEELIEIEENDIRDKLDSLMDRLTDFFSKGSDSVAFERVLDRQDREEKIDKFIQVLHLETDEKVRCEQEEFFGEIEIYPEENS